MQFGSAFTLRVVYSIEHPIYRVTVQFYQLQFEQSTFDLTRQSDINKTETEHIQFGDIIYLRQGTFFCSGRGLHWAVRVFWTTEE